MKKISIYPNLEHRKKLIEQEAARVKAALAYHSDQENKDELPQLPKDRIEWEYFCRPYIKGVKNRLRLRPMMLKIVKDQHPFKMLVEGRQWGKTTQIASDLAHAASTNNDYDQTYFNFKLDNLRTFSENKFRQDVFGQPPLSKYVSGVSKLGAMNRMVLKTRSIIDILLPGENWQNSQGKSNKRMVVDEGNDIDWSGFNNARQTQADTMGDTIIAGIGGYKGTLYHRLWLTTNQMEYFFKRGEPYLGYPNMSWRADLEFNDEGLIEDEYLLDVLDGEYVPQAPKNFSRHGYHLDQLQNPRIPITIESAIQDYKVNPEWSIEWQLHKDPNYSQSEFDRNNLALFVEGDVKPFTEEMMYKLVDKNLGFVPSDEVDHSLGDIFVGADWGGGPKTVVWVWQCIDEEGPVFRLLFAAKLEGQTSDEQYQTVRNVIDAYDATQSVVDSGGGTHQVEQLMKYYGPSCLRNRYTVRPEKPKPDIKEMIKLRKDNVYQIDKTYSLDAIWNLVNIPFTRDGKSTPRIILPGEDLSKIKWIIEQFCHEEIELITIGTSRQPYRRYYTPDQKLQADDALHACNYARIAWLLSLGRGTGHAGGGISDDD